jgi:protein phosphatase
MGARAAAITDRVMTPSVRRPFAPDARRLYAFDSAAVSHTGVVRDHNEDFAFVGEVLLAVADGVARSACGERASEIAIAAVAHLEQRLYRSSPADEVADAASLADRRVAEAGEQDAGLRGMATTLTVVRLDGPSVVVGQVGDSRAYRLRAGRLGRLTRDDSFVQQLVDEGIITPDQAARHPARSVVLQALGSGSVRPTVGVHDVVVGDRYLVCSDGLTDHVDEGTVGRLLGSYGDPGDCCSALLDAALDVGAPDNVTCVVGDVRPWAARA